MNRAGRAERRKSRFVSTYFPLTAAVPNFFHLFSATEQNLCAFAVFVCSGHVSGPKKYHERYAIAITLSKVTRQTLRAPVVIVPKPPGPLAHVHAVDPPRPR